MKVIEENNYIPNSPARNLAGKANNIITLFIYDEESDENYTHRWNGSNSSYYMRVIAELISAARKRHFIVSVYVVTKQPEYDFVAALFQSKAISCGVFAEFETQKKQLEKLIQQDYPMIILNPPEGLNGSENTFSIYNDDETGAYTAVCHLISNGHRRIGHITGDTRMSSQKRIHGYRRAMEDAGILIQSGWIRPGLFQKAAAYQAARDLLEKEDVTAIFVASDTMAVSVLHALQDMGKSVPEDVSVIGFDNSEILQDMGIELTTVEISLNVMAENVIKQACKEIDSKTCICPTRLIEKKTVKNINI